MSNGHYQVHYLPRFAVDNDDEQSNEPILLRVQFSESVAKDYTTINMSPSISDSMTYSLQCYLSIII